MKLVLLGVSGAGKGTQSKNIIKRYDLGHISTGDILRKHIREKTSIGLEIKDSMDAGRLVSDGLMLSIVKDVIKLPEFERGYVLDGFPRTLVQAERFNELQTIDLAIYVQVDDKIVIERLTGRWVCDSCSQMYHIKSFPPKREGACDHCGAALVQREDDKAETVRDRLEIFHELTEPIIDYYKGLDVLFCVSGAGDADCVTKTITEKLDTLIKGEICQ